MHDPMTVAHEIYLGAKKKKNGHYRSPIITIWHVDPQKLGHDDSCGWFMRAHHGDKEMLKKIRTAIEFDFDRTYTSESTGVVYYTGMFYPVTGRPNMSIQGIVLNMFTIAAWNYFKYNRKKFHPFMSKYIYDILQFSENPTDSLRDSIKGTFRGAEKWNREDALDHYSSIIYGWILRKSRPWYKHPRWHIRHWRIQFHPFQKLKRRYWDKCCKCGKRGFNGSAYGNWDGDMIWCQDCDKAAHRRITQKQTT